MTLLYPRLEAEIAREHFRQFAELELVAARARADSTRAQLPVTFAPTGGVRVSEGELSRIQGLLRASAEAFPELPNLARQRRFDFECARILHSSLCAVPGELLRQDVWRFLSAALVPDLVLWRYRSEDVGGITADRYLGGVRDTLSHLWIRAERLGTEPGGPLEQLREDNLVALMERPTLSRQVALCRSVATYFVELRTGTGADEDLLRDIMKRLTRLSGFVSYAALGEEHLAAFAQEAVRDSLRAFGFDAGTPPSPPESPQGPVVDPGEHSTPEATETQSPIGPVASVTPLAALDAVEQSRVVWEQLVGMGALRVDAAVRQAGLALRERGLITYERLRENGPIYEQLRGLMDNKTFFDIPIRGHRRALCNRIDDIPDHVIVRALGEVAYDLEKAESQVDRLLELLGDLVGFQRASPQRRSALVERLSALVQSGTLRVQDGVLQTVGGEAS